MAPGFLGAFLAFLWITVILGLGKLFKTLVRDLKHVFQRVRVFRDPKGAVWFYVIAIFSKNTVM